MSARQEKPGLKELKEQVKDLRETRRQLLESLDELREIQGLSRTIRVSRNPEEIREGLQTIAARLLPVPQLGLLLFRAHWKREAAELIPKALQETCEDLQGEGIIHWAMQESQPTVIPELGEEFERSLILVPLTVMGKGIGMLLVSSPIEQEQVTAQLLELLSFAGGQAALALENSRLLSEADEGRRYLQQMIDTAADLILVVGEDGLIHYVNHQVRRYRLSSRRMLGRRLQDFATCEEDRALLEQTLLRGERRLLDLQVALPDQQDEQRWVQCNLGPLPNPNGRQGEIMVILRDETKRRDLEQKARERDKFQAVMHAAVAVNHEINNPLTAILGSLFLLRKELKTQATPALLERIRMAEENCQRIQEVTSRLEKIEEIRLVKYMGDTEMLDLGPVEDELSGRKGS